MKKDNSVFRGDRVVLNNSTPWATYQAHIHRYIFASRYLSKDMIILDAGSGSGYGSNYLADYCKYIIGLDISRDAIDYSTKKFNKKNLNFVSGDITDMPFENNTFDIIISFMTIEHINKHDNFLSECNRILKDKGTFICCTDNKNFSSPYSAKPYNPNHTKEFYPEEFHVLLSKYFENIKFYGQTNHSLCIRKLRYWKNKFVFLFPIFKPLNVYIINYLARNRIREEDITLAILNKKFEVNKFEKRKYKRIMIAVCKKRK